LPKEAGDADQGGFGSSVIFHAGEELRVCGEPANCLGAGGVFRAFLALLDADRALPGGESNVRSGNASSSQDAFDNAP
jgi:hypothetical protein